MKTIIVTVIVGVVAGAGGYVAGTNGGTSPTDAKKIQDSITMMKEQSDTINIMGEMMKSAGDMMQTIGVQYKNDEVVASGKDLSAVAAKHLKGNEAETNGSDMMKEMMH